MIYGLNFVIINVIMGLRIFLSIVFSIIYFIMVSVMILFERKKPRVVLIWIAVFLLTQCLGYIAYLVVRCIVVKKKNSLLIKDKEDEIYSKLVSKHFKDYNSETDEGVFAFNQMVYGATTTENNSVEMFNTFNKFKDNLIKEIKSATNYMFMELKQFDIADFEDIKAVLINKAKDDLAVRVTFDCHIPKKLKKELKEVGIKINNFSKLKSVYSSYSNLRSIISIDGKVVYVGDFLSPKAKSKKEKIDYLNNYIKLKGEVVQNIDLTLRQDLLFSSGKHIQYNKINSEPIEDKATIQYVANNVNLDLEFLLVKAICTAKKSIQVQVNGFVPTDSIISLLKYVANSHLELRVMIPIKDYRQSRKFASRAFAKELALLGANVYLYDGYINYNSVVIDDEYAILGSYSMNRNLLSFTLQSMLLIKDEKVIAACNKAFDDGVKNSYRVSNAKYMLIREKLFKSLY